MTQKSTVPRIESCDGIEVIERTRSRACIHTPVRCVLAESRPGR